MQYTPEPEARSQSAPHPSQTFKFMHTAFIFPPMTASPASLGIGGRLGSPVLGNTPSPPHALPGMVKTSQCARTRWARRENDLPTSSKLKRILLKLLPFWEGVMRLYLPNRP